ncbi:MAG: nucleotide exchange factor GrpE [bacterium]
MSEEKNLEELQNELAKTQEQAQEYLAGWQRAQADYSNLIKESEKKRQELFEFANATFMAEVLPVYGHFKLGLKHIPEEVKKESWAVGLEQIQKQFQQFFKKYKIEEIKTVGEKFDHNLHEAISCEEQEGVDSDIIFEEVAPGYLVDGQILMPAKVKVAK